MASAPELVSIDQAQFVADVRALGVALADDDWRPDRIVGIGRGGLVPGVYLSHLTAIPLCSLSEPVAAGLRLLVIDDINDSGATLAAAREALLAAGTADLRLAVLIDNVRSPTRVDYRARTIDRRIDKSWYVFPWEALAAPATLIAEAREVPERLG